MWNEVKGIAKWDFEAKKTLEGVYVGDETAQGQNGEYKLFTIEDEAAGKSWKVSGSVLENRFAAIKPLSKVRITSLGKATGKSGNEYNDFKVEVWED